VSFNNPATNSFRGAFSLDEVHTREVNRDHPDTAGYNGTFGWITGSGLSTIDRIDFSNDLATATVRGSATNTYQWVTGVGNNNFGWFAGLGISYLTTVTRITFSNDTVTSVNRSGGLTSARNITGGLSNKDFGWIAGGATSPTTYVSTLDRIDFSNDLAVASLRGILTQAKSGAIGAANAVYGWFGGGYFNTPAIYSRVERLDFSSDTTLPLVRGVLTTTMANASATSNSNYGWWGGASPSISTVNRVDFSNDSVTASSRGLLAHSAQAGAAVGNVTSGWFAGGLTVSSVSRVDYSNDTVTATLRGPLSSAKGQIGGTSNYVKAYPFFYPPNSDTQTGGFGWIGSGSLTASPFYSCIVDRIDYSNDLVAASLRETLLISRIDASGTSNANYGWTGGGFSGTSLTQQSSVERKDFSNDTSASLLRGNLSIGKRNVSAAGNSNYGWFSGGQFIPGFTVYSVVDRIDYSNDNAIASTRGLLSFARGSASSVSNGIFGWVAGGGSPAPTTSIIDRMAFDTDLLASLARGPLTIAKYGHKGTGNTNFGWMFGGMSQPFTVGYSTIERIDYSSDTATAASRSALSGVRYQGVADGNAIYGWHAGGKVAGPPFTDLSTVERITYSNDTAAVSSRGTLSVARTNISGFSNYVKERQQPLYGRENGTYSWVLGGQNFSLGGISSIQRIDFSNDSANSVSRGNLVSPRYGGSSIGNIYYGWASNGFVPFPIQSSLVDRIEYASDTNNAVVRATSVQKIYTVGVSNQNYGWIAVGQTGGNMALSTVHRLDFSNDITALSTRGTSNIARGVAFGVGNSVYGWIVAGRSQSPAENYSSIDRIDYANDSITAASRGNISSGSPFGGTASGNSIYGWVIGGYNSGGTKISNIDRIDYSNDLAATSARGQLSLATSEQAASGSNTQGWAAGGGPSGFFESTYVNRIDYSNDTAIAQVRGNLTLAIYSASGSSNYVNTVPQPNVTQYSIGTTTAGTGAGTYGWFAGGLTPAPTLSNVDRIDFSNDSVTALARGKLTTARHMLAGTSNANYGWFTGSYASPTIVDRADFSNDFSTALVRGPLQTSKQYMTGVGNTNYGWFAAGYFFPPTIFYTSIDRIDYSNDGANALVRGSLSSSSKYQHFGLSNNGYGWFAGGYNATSVDRFTFSNDLAAGLIRSSLSAVRYRGGSISNSKYGWMAGGRDLANAVITTVNRLDFASDTASTLTRGPLTLARVYISGAGNSDYGWVTGGVNFTTPALYSTTDRIDYSNDSITASVKGSSIGSPGVYGKGGVSNYAK
jgi:hypothetical protein